MMIKSARPAGLGTVAALSLTGCALVGPNKIMHNGVPVSITVTSTAFSNGAEIPTRYVCKADGGLGISPPLNWTSVTDQTVRSTALVVDDTDVGGGYVHWALFNMAGTADEFTENQVPPHSEQARNTAGTVGYAPPCPPKGQVHTYRFMVYALNDTVPLGNGADLRDVLTSIAKRTVARGLMRAKFGLK